VPSEQKAVPERNGQALSPIPEATSNVNGKEVSDIQSRGEHGEEYDCEPGSAYGGDDGAERAEERAEEHAEERRSHGRRQHGTDHGREYARQRRSGLRYPVNIVQGTHVAEQDAKSGGCEPEPGERARSEERQRAHSGDVANGEYWS